MAIQTVFRRYELKYLLDPAQKAAVLAALDGRMALDGYGRTTIRNLYFDTDSYRLIRQSIEKPVYKEKLRVRSYRQVGPGEPVFVELKKKYKKVVYKRRLVMPEADAVDWLCAGNTPAIHSQIEEEIEYFRRFYAPLRPVVFLSYEREAFAPLPEAEVPDGFRVTFDENILARPDRLSLEAEVGGEPLLEAGKTLMEIKTGGGIPLWMVDVLTREGIYKTSFSKYGAYYENKILHQSETGRVKLC
ncbi:MAG: polyphosphate polymerase domain-containing protein [Clostridia bacterium]|nr:polyphosphate polymerase domain-containing protein [Clostridia bacterium]